MIVYGVDEYLLDGIQTLDEPRVKYEGYSHYISIDGLKPILRPLSDFNNSDADNEIFEIGKLYSSVELNELREFPQWQFEILVKHHFDVFGLIPQKIAIDINTIKP